MALISFASAKGSPGVTQTVTGLAGVWTSDVVIADLDPVGGDVGLRLRGEDGLPLDDSEGLLSYGAAVRGGRSAELSDHLQVTDDGTQVLVGVAGPGQVQGLGPAWPHIAKALRGSDADVLVDCGRIGPGSPVLPVIERSSALIMVARSDVSALSHLRERLGWLRDTLRAGSGEPVPLAVLLVGDAGDQRSADDLERLLASGGISVPVLGTVAHDPKTVKNLLTASERTLNRSLFIRSLLDVSHRVRALAASRDELRPVESDLVV